MRLKIELDPDATDRLIEEAIAERRPVPLQAEVILMRALGFDVPRREPASQPVEPESEPVQRGTD